MKTLVAIILVALAMLETQAVDIFTLRGASSYTLGSNDVAEVISCHSYGFLLNGQNAPSVASGGSGSGVVSLLPIVIAGVSNTISPFTQSTYLTIRIRTKAEYLSSLTVPSVAISSAVVIPEDAAGPVNVVMESSTDLVTWVAANPGTYGASTARRFFRVRAIQ